MHLNVFTLFEAALCVNEMLFQNLIQSSICIKDSNDFRISLWGPPVLTSVHEKYPHFSVYQVVLKAGSIYKIA